MQAQKMMTVKRFGNRRVGGSLIALGLAAGIALSIAAHTSSNDSTASDARPVAVREAQVHSFEAQGEGRGGYGLVSAVPTLKAHYSPMQGEGLINSRTATTVKAHYSVGAGEGWVALGRPRALPAAYTSAGQGEGWIALGRPVVLPTIAYTPEGQGEGWIALGRPSVMPLITYFSEGQGEGWIALGRP